MSTHAASKIVFYVVYIIFEVLIISDFKGLVLKNIINVNVLTSKFPIFLNRHIVLNKIVRDIILLTFC